MKHPDSQFEEMLKGNSNTLGRTIEVVEIVLKDKERLLGLYNTYFSQDEWVRLRVSNAMKRVTHEHPEWTAEFLDGLLNDISQINQASTQWTLAQLFLLLEKYMTESQKSQAIKIMQKNLVGSEDWIVLNQNLQTLGEWAKKDQDLKKWLSKNLDKFKKNKHNSVARKADKISQSLGV